ncbi:MAG: metallophosphoesterase [Nannocystaceae bacterium]
MSYRFLHLSDIHFGQEKGGKLVTHDDVRQMLIADAKEVADVHGAANLILVAGDITYSGQESEYRTAAEWLDQLAIASGCRDIDVRVVPGNHDCDLGQVGTVASLVHKSIRSHHITANDSLAGICAASDDANPLLPKLKAYRDFAAGYGCDFATASRPVWTNDLPLSTGRTLRLVGMNSVQVSDRHDTRGNMILGNAQYTLPDEPRVIYFTVMHHPLDWFLDKHDAERYLYNRAKILMFGHEHVSDLHVTKNIQGNEWMAIYSGAATPPETSDIYHHTYNWIEVSVEQVHDDAVLVVRVRPRVWAPERTRFAPDYQRLNGEESSRFEMTCRPFTPKAAVQLPARMLRQQVSPSDDSQNDGVVSGGLPTMTTHEIEAAAKLKLLFWRYLTWQQRLKILVEADALPASASQPLPQTLERQALENVAKSGKLADVWDAVMMFVPDEKKQSNPFRSSR